jgi:hypothetical protein
VKSYEKFTRKKTRVRVNYKQELDMDRYSRAKS